MTAHFGKTALADRCDKKERRRSVIMAAAYELFLEQGYSNVGMTDIIRRSGGSLSTAYELFENKAGLLRAMVTEQFASLHEVISNIAATEGPPEEALKATARDFLRILLDPGSIAMLRIIVAESLKDAAFGNCLSESAPERTAVALSGVFSNWRDQGLLDIDDPRQAADSFCALLVHKVQMSALCGVPEPMTEEEQTRHIDHVVRTICCRYGRGD